MTSGKTSSNILRQILKVLILCMNRIIKEKHSFKLIFIYIVKMATTALQVELKETLLGFLQILFLFGIGSLRRLGRAVGN